MSETWSLKELLSAGWSEQDLEWERLCEQLAGTSDTAQATEAAAAALRIARDAFNEGDPRLATSIANQAMCMATNKPDAANKLLDEARIAWNATHGWVDQMKASRVARSSLFHLRMELKHRAAYEENWRTKWRAIASDARQRVSSAQLGGARSASSSAEALARWQRERPAMLNDTRKLMAAAYLLLPGVEAGA